MCFYVKMQFIIGFLFLGRNTSYSGHMYGEDDFPGEMKLSFLPWIRRCVIKNNPALQQVFVLLKWYWGW